MDGVLNVIEPDTCCSPRFSRAARDGSLDNVKSWTCPKCGVEYRPQIVRECVRHWVAHVYVELVRPQR
jgi:hypothetical protein